MGFGCNNNCRGKIGQLASTQKPHSGVVAPSPWITGVEILKKNPQQ
jgi:hypothetical protein